MSQEFIIDGDHEEMVENWMAESVECSGCDGEGCDDCDKLGRVARCELTEEQLAEHDRIKEKTEMRCFGAISRAPNDASKLR